MNRLVMCSVAALFLVPVSVGAQQPVKIAVSQLMKQKLLASERVLEGLALEDYEKVRSNAERISLLTLDASWNVLQTPDYRRESDEFRRAADAISTAAKDENLEGATLAYMQMTMKCVHCHKYLRTKKDR